MKTLSQILENSQRNRGNGLGVTNHYTPIGNIVINVKNLFGSVLGAVVEEGEDHVSLRISCSRFITPEDVNRTLDECLYPGSYQGCSMRSYIVSQGLNEVKLVYTGREYVAYFCPDDIRSAKSPEEMEATKSAPKEMKEWNIEELEMDTIRLTEGADDDTELEDKTYQELIELIKSDNKIKAADKLSQLVAGEIELPKEYYFKAVKDADGDESIALRYKYEKRRPHGKKVELARSLMNIYGVGDEGVWVGEFEDKNKIEDDVITLIENILRLLGAKETEDPCVWSISENPEDRDKKDDKKDDQNGDEKKDDQTGASDVNSQSNTPEGPAQPDGSHKEDIVPDDNK